MVNFAENKLRYNVVQGGSEYANFNFDEKKYEEILEFHAI